MSPRWLSTCTAVVGSLTAGESALLAMSTMIRIANAGILLDRALDAEGDHPSHPPLGARARVVAVDLDERGALRHEVADAVAEHEPTPVCRA